SPGFHLAGFMSLAAGSDSGNRLVLVATENSEARVHHMNAQRDVEAQRWSGWMPFATAGFNTHLALGSNADGRLTLFAHLGHDGTLYYVSQVADGSTEWDIAWTQLASGDLRRFAVVRDPTPPAP